jgi:hypothetical protein
MHTETTKLHRRGFLGLLAVGALAGCAGGGPTDGRSTATPTAEDPTTTEGPMPTGTDSSTGGTSLAGSCASAFGDTDRRYDPGDRGLVATFAYPLAGTIYEESGEGGEYVTAIGYGATESGEYRHRVRLYQRGPVYYDVVETYTDEPDWVEDGTVRYDGTDRPVAVLQSDTTAQWRFGIDGPDGTYEIEVQVGANVGEPCPDVYENICARVANSFEPVSQ